MEESLNNTALFSAISKRYDFLNHLLSFNFDKTWRKKLIKLSASSGQTKILDICTGTGDIVIAFAKRNPLSRCFGIDLSEKMLEIAQAKMEKSALDQQIILLQADALNLPFEQNTFDIAFMGFGLRNLSDPLKGIQETKKVLKKGGKVFILEFSPETDRSINWFYKVYLNRIVPFLGRCISANNTAYKYLASSIPAFLAPDKVTDLMKDQGYINVKATPLTKGIVYIYEGTK